MEKRVRVRYAPSPTGYLHIGGLRTALYNELFARRHNGDFLLRIEDTDQGRYVEGAAENLCRSLKLCGVIPDEGAWIDEEGKMIEKGSHGPYIQSKRKDRHQAYAKQLLEMGKAYYCFCTAERLTAMREEQQLMKKPTIYDGHCRAIAKGEAEKRVAAGETHVVRLKLPREGKATVVDLIRGEVEFEWNLIDDQVILKSDGFPTYHLAAMCDDHDMEITHIIRGEEWLSSAPKHIFIFESFGWDVPQFAHLPLLLNPDRSKLSKRQGDVAVEDYLNKGYLPEALVNFVALLGWNPSSDREIYAHAELSRLFDLTKVNKAGAILNMEKLDWTNEQYLRALPLEEYFELALPFVKDLSHDQDLAKRAVLLVRDRIQRPSQVRELTEVFFKDSFDFSAVSLTWKTQSKEDAKKYLQEMEAYLATLPDGLFGSPETRQKLEETIKAYIQEKGWKNGEVLWPLRVALSGQEKSPSPFELFEVYGKEMGLRRIQAAIASL